MYNFIFNNLIWTEGKYIFLVFLFLFLLFLKINYFFSFVFLFFLAIIFYFFRNPNRSPEIKDNLQELILSPADGKVLEVKHSEVPIFEDFYQKVSIFLSPVDAHVNWIPMSGFIREINYKPGKFIFAFLPKSSEFNEKNDILIQNKFGKKILVRQIAGAFVRRIVCWLKIGDQVNIGQKYGMIKFGSRVDIFFQKNVKLNVTVNQKVYGGQTILGILDNI